MPRRIYLFGVQMDAVTSDQAVGQIQGWIEECLPRCRYVVTPNVDHAVMLQESVPLQSAYANADLVLADGWPVVAASRLLGRPLPARVAGSDLVPALFDATNLTRPITAFLLGALPGVAERAARRIQQQWPNVRVTGTYSPPFGFERNATETSLILERIGNARPDVLVAGLGAPKQELWVAEHRDQISAKVALCVGATIDFLAGEKARAPKWLQQLGLEWFHRMASEPQRLAGRYARDAYVFPRLVLAEWWAGLKRA